MAAVTHSKAVNTSPFYSIQLRKFGVTAIVTMLALVIAITYLLPFGNMALLAVKNRDQIVASSDGPVWPMEPEKFTYQDKTYDVYNVPFEDGTRELALVTKGRQSSEFIDPANPDAGVVTWEGSWRTLEQVSTVVPHFENFNTAWDMINFPRLFGNTLGIALIGMVGTLLSSICVAYAFARFPIPGKNILFIILIGTIILPSQVTLIPTYAFFAKIGWINSWLPLTVPHFFANAYNVFLLRQFFLTLPRELDEAAMIDGATPFQVLTKVIIPQSWPAIISVGLFHFIFAWNDYFGPLLYLLGRPDLQPISVGVQVFNFQYGARPELVQATSLMAMVLPLVIFFFAQKIFMRGVVVTGVEK
ncbi:MAG: carbohydrate ABC transporter permease [Anaerolineae bacterium]|nr:carbohydrate ABC transporter permease [Anaerolineae bacterium]